MAILSIEKVQRKIPRRILARKPHLSRLPESFDCERDSQIPFGGRIERRSPDVIRTQRGPFA
jgi:hypothetical protein